MIKIPAKSENDFKKMPVGGYVCRIVKAESSVNRYEVPCLVLYLDVAEGDFKNYFGDIYERRLEHGEKKYPCVYNQTVGKFSRNELDKLIAAVEASNNGYSCKYAEGEDWDERELENLLVGVVFREKEFINARGKQRVYLIPHELKSVEEIRRGEFKIPRRRYE